MIIGNLIKLWRHIPGNNRRKFVIMLLLMFFSSLLEIISIGSIVPFLSVLIDPSRVFFNPNIQPLVVFLGISSPQKLVAPITAFFVLCVVSAGLIRLLLLKVSTNISFATGADLSLSIFERTLYQSYHIHISRNSSEVISGVISKITAVIYGVIIPLISLINASIMLTVIFIVMIKINIAIALAVAGGFGFIYLAIIKNTRVKVALASKSIAYHSTNVVKVMQEGLGGIRDILLYRAQKTYCETYKISDMALRNAQKTNQFVGESPRYIIESFGISLIACLAYVMTQEPDVNPNVIPILGAFALGAQRFLPVLQQAFGSITSIRSAQASLFDVLFLLDQPMPFQVDSVKDQPLVFNTDIKLLKISYRYSDSSPFIVKNINLTVKKGSRVGLIGTTGSGKSTLLDVLMGLLEPTQGEIQVDSTPINKHNMRYWQSLIAHVPQNIFLCDSSVSENIAIGVPPSSIDHGRVRLAAEKAQIAATIESWDHGYQTRIGERGVKLSGGQRQRIGIARALYRKADIIIFDEATSALDNFTEMEVMNAIESLGEEMTVFMVAHRLSTLRNCSQIIELDRGEILRLGSYTEIIKD